MLKVIPLFLFLALVQSCSWVKDQEQYTTIKKESAVNKSDSFYVIYPKNGYEYKFMQYNELQENKDSAKEAISAIRSAITEKLGTVHISSVNMDLEKGLAEAKLMGTRYLLDVNIAYWKDASYITCASNSGKFYLDSSVEKNNEIAAKLYDKMDVTLKIYDVETSKLVNEQRMMSAGCPVVLLGFIPIGKSSPKERLQAALQSWMQSL